MARTEGAPPKREAAPERVAAFQTGLSAESRAAAYLMAKGYRILAKRFRTPHGEIDLVVRRRNLVAFVEVRPPSRSRRISRGASSMRRRHGSHPTLTMPNSSCVLMRS